MLAIQKILFDIDAPCKSCKMRDLCRDYELACDEFFRFVNGDEVELIGDEPQELPNAENYEKVFPADDVYESNPNKIASKVSERKERNK